MSTGNTAASTIQNTTSRWKKMTEAVTRARKAVVSMSTSYAAAVKAAEDASEVITLATGATGAKLTELTHAFETVGSKVPIKLTEVTNVIAHLSNESKATGLQLEVLAKSVLDASRIAGIESSKMMEMATKTIKDWGLSAAQSVDVMDKLYVASEKSGMKMTEFSDRMKEQGGSLQKLGFNFDQSLVLLTKWQKEGTNAKDVIETMQAAFTQLSKKNGITEPAKAFQELIQKMGEVGSEAEALKIATVSLGKTAGKNLADAVNAGALALDQDLLEALKSSSGALDKQSKATLTLKERWTNLHHLITLAMPTLLEFGKNAGKTLIDAGNKANAAYKTIRVGTGATGAELKGLLSTYDSLGKQVPDDLGKVADIVTGLRTSTGATGVDIEILGKTMLDTARLIGVDSAKVMATSTDVINTWGIAMSDSTRKLFVASQKSGTGFIDLGTQMKVQGELLSSMGFNFNESLVMLTQWGKEGKSAKDIVDMLNTAFTTLSNQNGIKNPIQSFQELIGKIQSTADEQEALKLATQGFGEVAGKGMAKAIRSGTFALNQDLMTALQSSKEAISKHTGETMTLGEKWAVVSNQISIALAPIGQLLLDLAGSVIPLVGEAISFITEHSVAFSSVLIGVGAAIFTAFIPSLLALIPTLLASAAAGWAAIAPFLPIIGIAALVGAAIAALAYVFQTNLWGIGDTMKDVFAIFKALFQLITLDFEGAWNTIAGVINKFLSGISVIKEAMGFGTLDFRVGGGNAAAQPQGHYHGLDYIPYDGYVARLHKGERVITAQENKSYTGSMGGTTSISITGNTFNVRQESDIDAIARALAREIKAAGGLMS
jgi:phage-related minor tail protein